MTSSFALNSAATAMDHAQAMILELTTLIARDGVAVNNILPRAVDARRDLQLASDAARAAATEIFNDRRRYQRMLGIESLRDIA